jgi:hypothetical protein
MAVLKLETREAERLLVPALSTTMNSPGQHVLGGRRARAAGQLEQAATIVDGRWHRHKHSGAHTPGSGTAVGASRPPDVVTTLTSVDGRAPLIHRVPAGARVGGSGAYSRDECHRGVDQVPSRGALAIVRDVVGRYGPRRQSGIQATMATDDVRDGFGEPIVAWFAGATPSHSRATSTRRRQAGAPADLQRGLGHLHWSGRGRRR